MPIETARHSAQQITADRISGRERTGHGRIKTAEALLPLLLLSILSGCTSVFTQPVMNVASQPLPWLANLAPPPVELTPLFDLGQIQPAARTGLAPQDMLEITIWDLYEPGKPHTFPCRVDAQGKIEVPHLSAIDVAGASTAEIESRLVANYQTQDVLKQPRVLVRPLAGTPLHIYVTGAVLRPGLIDLPQQDPSVFAALVAAGGLSRNAGLHVFVTDRQPPKPADAPQASVEDLPQTVVAGNTGLTLPTTEPAIPAKKRSSKRDPIVLPPDIQLVEGRVPPELEELLTNPPPVPAETDVTETADLPPQQLVNHSKSLTITADGKSVATSTDPASGSPVSADLPNAKGIEERTVTRPDHASAEGTPSQSGKWYDLSVERDRQLLKELVLRDGDMVTVRPAAPPVRITGAVTQPGSYRAPASNTLTVMDAIQLAGGCPASQLPVVIILTRPATAEQGLQRWNFRLAQGETPPSHIPYVQPGDSIHVERTARARVRSLVDAVLPSGRR